MNIMIFNPEYPKDKSKARPLSKEQFDVVHDYIVESMNSHKAPKDQVIVDMLIKAGLPIDFSPICICKVCKKEVKLTTVHGGFQQWKATADEDQTMAQYCWADPAGGSELHVPV